LILNACKGDDVEYGDFEEKLKGGDIFDGSSITLANFTADPFIFDPTDITAGTSRFYNSQCSEDNAETPFCTDGMRFTVGSTMVNYSNPQAPNIQKLVGVGGRGITIYRITKNEESGDNVLELVWDSADDFEREGCATFPVS